MLADWSRGGGCTADEDLECIRNSEGFRLTPSRAQVGTKLYLSCSVGDHCTNGQTLVVTIIDGAGPPAAALPAFPASAVTVKGDRGEAGPMGPAGPAGPAGSGGSTMLLVGLLIGAFGAGGVVYVWSVQCKGAAPMIRDVPMVRAGASDDPRHASTMSGPAV